MRNLERTVEDQHLVVSAIQDATHCPQVFLREHFGECKDVRRVIPLHLVVLELGSIDLFEGDYLFPLGWSMLFFDQSVPELLAQADSVLENLDTM